MTRIHVRVEGVRDCIAALQALKASVANRVLAQAVAKRASEVNKLAKGFLRKGKGRTGLLKQSVGVKRAKVRKPYVVAAVVGPRKSFAGVGPDGRKHLPHKIAHLAEGGRKAVVVTNKKVLAVRPNGAFAGVVFGKRVRAVQGQHFMQRAYTAARAGWRTRMAADIAAGIDREAKRAARRAGGAAARGLGRGIGRAFQGF